MYPSLITCDDRLKNLPLLGFRSPVELEKVVDYAQYKLILYTLSQHRAARKFVRSDKLVYRCLKQTNKIQSVVSTSKPPVFSKERLLAILFVLVVDPVIPAS